MGYFDAQYDHPCQAITHLLPNDLKRFRAYRKYAFEELVPEEAPHQPAFGTYPAMCFAKI